MYAPLLVGLLALDRASFLQNIASLVVATTGSGTAPVPLIASLQEELPPTVPWKIELPLDECAGGSYCVRMNVQGSSGTRIYRAAVDTGSPYLVLSGDRDILSKTQEPKDKQQPFVLSDSAYPATEEIYGSESGFLDWKEAQVTFRSTPRLISDKTTLAMMDDQLEVEAGGTLLGLVKHPNPPRQLEFYRPTWLQQVRFKDGSSVKSFSIDQEKLVLSNQSLLTSKQPQIPLVDLRPLGDFIEHYCFAVKEIDLGGGFTVTSSKLGGRPIVAVLDTGLTGCLLTQPFWNALTEEMNIDPRRIRQATVRATTSSKRSVVDFTSGRGFNNLFYIVPISLDWFLDEAKAPYLIVLGQTFLSQGKLTVDMEDRLASFEL